MIDVLHMSWRYLAYHKVKTVILVISITLIVYLPIGLKVVVNQSAESLTTRAEATPLIIGAKGSPLELVLNTLYFESNVPAVMQYGQSTRVSDYGLWAAASWRRAEAMLWYAPLAAANAARMPWSTL